MNLKLIRLFVPSILYIFLSQLCWAESPYMASAIEAFNKGNYSEAVGLLGAAKPAEFENPVWHYYMANALVKLHQKEEAIKEYKMAMDLAPAGQLKQYCQLALQALVPTPVAPPTHESVGGGKPAAQVELPSGPPVRLVASQQPHVISLLCGCPLCHRLDLILTDLQSKYGNDVKFTRTMMRTPDKKEVVELDPQVQDVLKKYSIRECPSVIVFNSQGAMQNVFSNYIPADQLTKVVDDMAKTSPVQHFKKLSDESLDSRRQAIVDEFNAQVSHDQLRLDQEIKQIESDADQQMSQLRGGATYSVGRYRGYMPGQQTQIDDIQNEAKNKIETLRNDFERRKQAWSKAADEKIHALESTQTSK
jgi:thiol-disulfide isomerase/thioredoxin